jgi:hypothetical protein
VAASRAAQQGGEDMSKAPQARILVTAIFLVLGLGGCGDPVGDWLKGRKEEPAAKKTDRPPPFELPELGAPPDDAAAAAAGEVLTLAMGPDICFRKIAERFGADVKVSEITSFFGGGEGIGGITVAPRGQMTSCSVSFQSPSDPRKLLSSRYDLGTGSFSAPQPVEITVMGGNAADFRLADYVIPLSRVNAAALTGVMHAQEARLKKVYGDYAWTGVRLSSPGAFSNTHTLRLDLDGRLASNDIKESGYASVSLDGKRITADYLMP